jgi:mannose-6-phosphate isomerase-like protein (cupin superfamily)
MSGYTTCSVEDAPDVFGGKYPGAMRFMGGVLGAEQLAFTHRLLPAQSGGKGSYGHRHQAQEEIYYVVTGRLEFKLGDDVVELGPRTALRVATDTWRSVWNEGPGDAELLIVSVRRANAHEETEMLADFWPA